MGFSGTGKVWMNGSLVDWPDAKIHIASHIIHSGSGVFESARCYQTPKGSAVRLEAHMRRLYDSAKIYRMEYRVDKADNAERRQNAVEFYEFGLGEVYPISSLHGLGTGDLLDAVVASFEPIEKEKKTNRSRLRLWAGPTSVRVRC